MITLRMGLPADGTKQKLVYARGGAYGSSLLIYNKSDEEVGVGNIDTCTASDNFPIPPGTAVGIDVTDNEVLYFRSNTGGEVVAGADGLCVMVSK